MFSVKIDVRLVPTADIAPELYSLPPRTDDPLGRCSSREGPVLQMSRRAEHYRGYNIDGNMQARRWSVEVHPNTPDLPILRRAVFRVIHPAWTEALVQARARIDARLR